MSQANSPIRLEDVAAGSGDSGIPVWGLIETTPTSLAASGDYAAIKLSTLGQVYTEPSNQVATFAYANYAESSITASFTTALTNSAKIKILTMSNKTDQALEISYDATNVRDYLSPGETVVYDLGASGRWIESNISVRYVVNPTTGVFIVAGKI
jgi:hypothetical protein